MRRALALARAMAAQPAAAVDVGSTCGLRFKVLYLRNRLGADVNAWLNGRAS